jgi:hypothetical protein
LRNKEINENLILKIETYNPKIILVKFKLIKIMLMDIIYGKKCKNPLTKKKKTFYSAGIKKFFHV